MSVTDAVAVLRRWWWLIVGLPVVVGIVSWIVAEPPPIVYESRLRFAIDIPRSALVEGSDEGTAAKIGESLIDDISRIIPSEAFAAAVTARLGEGAVVSPGELASELSASDRHRVADVWVRRSVPAGASETERALVASGLQTVAAAAVVELEERGVEWFARLGEENVSLAVIDGPSVVMVPPTARQRLELPLRIALALAVAVALAFLLDALDPRLHGDGEAEEIFGAPVIGRIPRSGRSLRLG